MPRTLKRLSNDEKASESAIAESNEAARKLSRQKLPLAVRHTFWLSLCCLIALELWRPLYFLTDDNLTYWLPVVSTMGQQIWHSTSPAINPYLFGGHFDLLHDPSSLSLWNPLVLLSSLLANTPALLTIVDVNACLHLLLGASMFALLLCRLREWKSLTLSDSLLVLLSLSYTFSSYALIVGPSWLMFLANQAALPILLLGLLHPQRRRGIALVTGGLIYALWFGHVSPFLFTLLFLTLFVGLCCCLERSTELMQRWAIGGTLAFLLMLPLLLPAFGGFAGSSRNTSLNQAAALNAVPLAVFITSFLGGYISVFPGIAAGIVGITLEQSFVSCAAAWLIVLGYVARRKFTSLEIACGIMALVVMLFVVRPYWLQALLNHLPLFRSLRWPFREIFICLFFLHVGVAFRLDGLSPRQRNFGTLGGLAVFLVSLIVFNQWSFAPMTLDRDLIFSGEATAYWQQLRAKLHSEDQIITIIPAEILKNQREKVPFSLLGGYNFPALFTVRSASGYTAAGMQKNTKGGIVPHHWSGVYSPEDGTRLLARNRRLKALRLMSLHPLRITLCDVDGMEEVPLPPMLHNRRLSP